MTSAKPFILMLAFARVAGCAVEAPVQQAQPEPPKRTVSAEAEKAAREQVQPHALILEWNVPYEGDASYRAIFVHELDDTALESIMAPLKLLHPYDLCFSQTKITDASLAKIAELTTLKNLNLAKTSVNDQSLALLKPLVKLTDLNLSDTAVSDKGLVHLHHFKRLERLTLSGTAVSDAGLARLKFLASLKYLSVDRSAVSDQGLLQLAQLKNLRTLDVSNDHITAAGINALKKASPKLLVSAIKPPPERKKREIRETPQMPRTTFTSAPAPERPKRAESDRLPPRRDTNRRTLKTNNRPLQPSNWEPTP